MSAKEVPWTVTVWGRRVVRGVALTCIGGTFLLHYLPNNLLQDQFRNITQRYRIGKPMPVSEKVKSLVQEVMSEMGVKEVQEKVSLFTSVGYDFFRFGSPHSHWGAILGIPTNIKWETEDEINKTEILVKNAPVAWSTEAGKNLSQSFVLSRNAKKFIIARELHDLNTCNPLVQALTPTLAVFMAYTISLGINKKGDLYNKPRSLRVSLYSLAGLLGYSFYILAKDMRTVSAEEECDAKAAAMGVEYAEGGVEYYNKLLQRNVALRELMGSEGEGLFTAKGNDEVLLRTKHLPNTIRLDKLKEHLKKYKEEEKGP